MLPPSRAKRLIKRLQTAQNSALRLEFNWGLEGEWGWESGGGDGDGKVGALAAAIVRNFGLHYFNGITTVWRAPAESRQSN